MSSPREFRIQLNDEEDGVRIRVFENERKLADGVDPGWSDAFRTCIEALLNGLKGAEEEFAARSHSRTNPPVSFTPSQGALINGAD